MKESDTNRLEYPLASLASASTVDIAYPVVLHINPRRKCATNSEIRPTVQLLFPSLDKPVSGINDFAESSNSHLFHGQTHHEGEHIGVVVKILKYGEKEQDSQRVRLFTNGAELHRKVSDHAASLGLARVARVYDSGSLAGTYLAEELQGMAKMDMYFMLVEHVPGEEITKKLNSPKFSYNGKHAMLRQVAEGIMAAHDAGCVHRDIKPHNAIECPDDGVKLIDFGLAGKIGDVAHESAGTIPYLAPEGTLHGTTLDPRLDVFSFGVMAYEAFEGRHPYMTKAEKSVSPIIRNNKLILPKNEELIASGLGNIIIACLQKDTSKRIRDGHALLEAFDAL